jgi:hypothetical protein
VKKIRLELRDHTALGVGAELRDVRDDVMSGWIRYESVDEALKYAAIGRRDLRMQGFEDERPDP